MIIACIHCGKNIGLDITNVLRQRIEDEIKRLEGLLQDIEILDYDYVDNSRANTAQYLRDLLK